MKKKLSFKYILQREVRWFPRRFKRLIRRTLRKLKLMSPYEPVDTFGRPFPLEHALSCVGKGWAELIKECYAVCVEYETDVSQVKEKFGGLRFYVGGSTLKTLDEIEDICDRSYRICENCGNPGKTTRTGWFKTLCDECTKVEMDYSHELEHLLYPGAKMPTTEEMSGTINELLRKLDEEI